MRRFPRLLPRLLPILLLSALAGCSVLPEAQTSTVYLLPAEQLAASATPAVDWALRVATPQTSQVLDSTRVAVVPQPNQISGYKGARWSDPAPALLRNRLLEGFRADGRVTALSSDVKPLHADLALVGDLRAFQAEYREGGVQVVIRLDAHLALSNGQRIVAARQFEVRQVVQGSQVDQVVGAFGQAGDRLAAQVVDWTLEQGQAHARSARAVR
ncbi:MAG: ABC-type transport auxiliary lipoprotein family protein [Pseudomonadota bacterium]